MMNLPTISAKTMALEQNLQIAGTVVMAQLWATPGNTGQEMGPWYVKLGSPLLAGSKRLC